MNSSYLCRVGLSERSASRITRRSRGIHAAWHFWYAVASVVKVVCGSLVYAAFTP